MGSQCHDPPSVGGLIDDLRVTIEDTSLVLPSRPTERRTMFLSNIDKVLNFTVETLHFFPAHPDFPAGDASQRLKASLAELLVPYDFFAGRLKNGGSVGGRLEVDCNAAGAAFVAASSQLSLDDIGDLAFPNPAFSQLVVKTIDTLPPDDHPLFIMQVTKFKCGGFVMGISSSHTLVDGFGFKLFLQNLAAVAAFADHLPFPPCNDRHLLAARCPPQVTFPHLELTKLQDSTTKVFDATKEALCFKIFHLTISDINTLKEKAQASLTRPVTRISRFNIISALVWRCKALSSSANNPDRESTLLFAVDIRPRLVPPLPVTFSGNAVLTSYARATCRELEQWPLGKVAELVAEGANRMTNEYARSMIDWGEINQGYPHGEVLISSWWRLGFEEVKYPWGQPRYSCPVVYPRKDIILLLSDHIKNKGGVNVFVALPADEMSKFQSLFP